MMCRTRMRRIVSLITGLIILLGASTSLAYAQDPTAVPRFEVSDCPFKMPQGESIDCGYVVVPENRAQPDGRVIHIFVARVRSHSPTPKPDPILYLNGGPGGKAQTVIESLSRFDAWLAGRDLLLFDQRGVGWSKPALDCPELKETLLQEYLGARPALEAQLRPRLTCRDRWLKQGIDLGAYNSAELAADAVAVWQALGYKQVNLYSVSYGTIPAQMIMRDHQAAQSVRSVILDSAVPLTASVMAETPALVAHAMDRLFAECAADLVCRAAYPDLKDVYYQVIQRLQTRPVSLPGTNPLTGEPFSFQFGVADFGSSIIYGTYRSLPKQIYDIHDGNYQGVIEAREEFVRQLNEQGAGDAFGLRTTVNCNEPWQTISPEQQSTMQAYPEAAFIDNGLDAALCQEWASFGYPEQKPAVSDIPSLILMGEYDVRLSGYGETIAASLSRSTNLLIPRAPHDVLQGGGTCPNLIALAFLDKPAQSPDVSCLATANRSAFDTQFVVRAEAMQVPAKGLLGALSLLTLGLAVWVGWGMRRYRLSGWKPGLAWRGSLRLIGPVSLLGGALLVTLAYLGIQKGLLPFHALDAVAIGLPMVVAIQAAFLFSPEDEPALEVMLATPRPPAWTLLERLLTLFAVQGSLGLASSFLLSSAAHQPTLVVVGRWLPLLLLLSGIAVAVTLTTRRAILGVWVASLVWLVLALLGDFLTLRWPVAWVVHLYLPPEHSAYLLNRLLISLAGIALLGSSIARLLNNSEYLLLGQPHSGSRRQLAPTTMLVATSPGRSAGVAAPPRWGVPAQLGAMLRYEFLLQWRGAVVPALAAAFMVTPMVGAFIELETFRGYQTALAHGTLAPAVARADITARLIPITWLGVALISTLMLPLAAANAIPRDREVGVRELLDALPLSPGVYLAGKLFGLWLSLFAGLVLAALVIGGVWRLMIGPFDMGLYTEMWLVNAALLVFINAGLSVLLAAGQPSTRRAILVGGVVVLLALMGMGFALVDNGWLQWFNPARPAVHLYYVLGFPGALAGNDERTQAVVAFVRHLANPPRVRLALATGLAQVGLVWLVVWQWLKPPKG
jgi:pimeloyl-ACP methyl ester carboxylesterase